VRDFTDAIRDLQRRLNEAEIYLRIDELRRRRPQLETELARPDLWDQQDEAQAVQREFSAMTDDITLFETLAQSIEDAEVLYELAREESDESQEDEIAAEIDELVRRFNELELRALFTGQYDELDVVCEVHSGAGGTDSQDWAEMLMRMYLRWAERRGFEIEVDELLEGQEAGITSATFILKGRYAYGLMRSEHGVHRLVRISPFDSAARRHTAFASVHVTPMIEDASNVLDIDDKDLRIDTFRASGAGGQHINKTDSAIRITHLPTGLVVSCQNERSQHQNKDRAMQILATKLLDLQRQEQEAKLAAITGETTNVEWGSQIRSYVLQPYQQVKDLRSGKEIGNVEGVLDGDISELMEAYLRWERAGAN